MANRYKLELVKNMPMAYNSRDGMYKDEDGRMGRKKKEDTSEKVDKRNRQSIVATVDLDTADGKLISEHYAKIRKGAGLTSWRNEVINALALFIKLKQGDTSPLIFLFPRFVEAVRLFLAIESGDLSVMRELFPERYQVFKLQLEADILETINMDNQKDVLRELRQIKTDLANLKASGVSSGAQSIGGIKQIGTLQPVAAPNFEDDDEDLFGVSKDKTAGERAANNFLASLKRL